MEEDDARGELLEGERAWSCSGEGGMRLPLAFGLEFFCRSPGGDGVRYGGAVGCGGSPGGEGKRSRLSYSPPKFVFRLTWLFAKIVKTSSHKCFEAELVYYAVFKPATYCVLSACWFACADACVAFSWYCCGESRA